MNRYALLAAVMAAVMIFTGAAAMVGGTSSADGPAVVDSGTDGGSLSWVLTDDGTLTISGNGPMKEFASYHVFDYCSYSDIITQIVVQDGVTSLSDNAFDCLCNIVSVVLPLTLVSIGSQAFSGCFSLISLDIPSSVTFIAGDAFSMCRNLFTVSIHSSSVFDFVDSNMCLCSSPPLKNLLLDTSDDIVFSDALFVSNCVLTLSFNTVNSSGGVLYDTDGVSVLLGSDRAGFVYNSYFDSHYNLYWVASEKLTSVDDVNGDSVVDDGSGLSGDGSDTVPFDYSQGWYLLAAFVLILIIAFFAYRSVKKRRW